MTQASHGLIPRGIPSVILATLLTLFALPFWAPLRAQGGLLRGTVTDAEKNPLSGVRVTVTSQQLGSFRKVLTTDADGEFKLRFQKNQTQYRFQMLLEKPGYQSFTQPLAPSSTRLMKEVFEMAASQSRVVEGHGDLASVVTGSTSVAVEAFNAGLTAQKAGDLETAVSRFEAAVAADPSLVPARIGLAQVLLDRGEHGAALGASDRALELDPGRAEALRVKHQALRGLGRRDEAEAVSSQLEAAEEAVASARRFYNEGGEAFQANDHDTALGKFQKAAELDPSLVEAHHAIATLQLAKGKPEESAEAAEKALALGSEDLSTLRVLYDAYDALGRTAELAEIAPRLAAVDPDFGGAKLVEQAADLWNAGQAEKAAALSRLALAIDPGLAKAYYFVGLDHLSKGESAEAKAALRKFIELAPEDPEAETAREMLTYIE